MIQKLKALFTQKEPADPTYQLHLAYAALLVEVAKSDFERDEREFTKIRELLRRDKQLEEQDIEALIHEAEEHFESSNAYHPYTSLINEHFQPERKVELIEMLWHVAMADGEISKYEDHLIRKISELLYVPHRDFIRSKLKVLES